MAGYNANGDLTNVQLTSTTANTFTYDALGKLKSANMAGTSSPTYSYDVFGRRVHRLDGTTFKSHFLWENNHLIANVGSGGGIQKEYVYTGENVNSPDYMVASSVNYRIIKDQLGSPRLVVSAVDGTVSERMDYNDLGAVISDSNPGFQAFGFAGGLYDGLTKYTRFGAREYDAESGRWTTKDPILFKGGDTNLYGYVQNDPINFVDPSGKAIGLDDAFAAIFVVGTTVGITEGIVNYRATHSFSSATKAAANGFVMGAGSAGAAILTATLGAGTAVAAGAATVFDIGYSLLTAPTSLPTGSSNDFINGINAIGNQKQLCPEK